MTARAVRFSALSPGSYALPTGRESFGEGGPRWDVAGILWMPRRTARGACLLFSRGPRHSVRDRPRPDPSCGSWGCRSKRAKNNAKASLSRNSAVGRLRGTLIPGRVKGRFSRSVERVLVTFGALPTLQCVKTSGRMSKTDQESQENQDFFEPWSG